MLAKLHQNVHAGIVKATSHFERLSPSKSNSSPLLFRGLFSHFQHAVKACGWENVQRGTYYIYGRLHTIYSIKKSHHPVH